MEDQKRFGILAAFIAAIFFGAAAPLSKPLLPFLNNYQMAGLLYLGAALGVSLILIKEKSMQWPWQIQRKEALKLSGAIIFGGILGPLFLLAGLRIAAASSVSLWLNLELLATAVLGHLFFKDYLSKKGWLASIGALGAATLLAWEGGIAGFKAGGLIVLACICWGIDNHLTALIDGITPAQSTFWKGLFAGSFNLVLGLLMGSFTANAVQTLGALGLGVVSYGLSILLYITSAQHLGATRSQLIFSSAPFFGLFIALLFGEAFTLIQFVALVTFLISIYVLFKETHSHAHIHQALIHTHMHTHPNPHHDHEHLELSDASVRHIHAHEHTYLQRDHPHWPDIHHRHEHSD